MCVFPGLEEHSAVPGEPPPSAPEMIHSLRNWEYSWFQRPGFGIWPISPNVCSEEVLTSVPQHKPLRAKDPRALQKQGESPYGHQSILFPVLQAFVRAGNAILVVPPSCARAAGTESPQEPIQGEEPLSRGHRIDRNSLLAEISAF